MDVSEALREWREALGLTQYELGDKTGIHRSQIGAWEAGRHSPTVESLERLAGFFRVDVARFLSGPGRLPAGTPQTRMEKMVTIPFYLLREAQPLLPDLAPDGTYTVPADLEIARLYLSLDDPRMRRAVLLGLLAGMRPSEILRADSSWVHREAGEIQIPPRGQKTSVTNRLPIVATLAGELAGVEGRLVPMSTTAIRGVLLRRSKRLRLTPPLNGLETFRHTAATGALEETGNQSAVDLILSHATIGSTRHYTQLAQAVAPKRAALELVEGRFLRALAGCNSGTPKPGNQQE